MTVSTALSASVGRRSFLAGSAALAATAIMGTAGCSRSRAGAGPGQITLWNGWTGGNNQEMLGQVLKAFQTSMQDKVTITNTAYPWDTLFSKWQLATASGNAPDAAIFHVMEVLEFAGKKIVAPIGDDLAKLNLNLDNLPKNVLDQCFYEDKLHAVPLDSFPLGLYINTELAQKAGLDVSSPPKTSDELAAWAEKLTTRKGSEIVQQGLDLNPNGNNQRWLWQTFTYQLGGELYHDGKWSVNSPEAKQALQFIVDLIHKQKVSQTSGGNSSSLDAFSLKKAAMYFTGPWDVQFRLTQKTKIKTAKVPLMGPTEATWGGSHAMSVSPADGNDARANSLTFIKWFYENYVQAATAVGTIPLNPAVLSTDAWTKDERHVYYKPFEESVAMMRYDPITTKTTQLFPWGDQTTPFTRMMSSALTATASVTNALDDLQKALESE